MVLYRHLASVGLAVGLLLAAATSALAGQPQEPKGHYLVSSSDLAVFGEVQTVSPSTVLQRTQRTGPVASANWIDAGSATYGIYPSQVATCGGGCGVALVTSSSYHFANRTDAQTTLRSLPDVGKTPKWSTIASDGSLLDPATKSSVAHVPATWRYWHGKEADGYPGFAAWSQFGSYVFEVTVLVAPGQEDFGRRVFNGALGSLAKQESPAILSEPAVSSVTQTPVGSVTPMTFYGEARAYTVGSVAFLEYAAFWSLPYGSNQRWDGPGGNQATCDCPSHHGCISSWNWTSQAPEAKLLVPKTWLFDCSPNTAWNGYFYVATFPMN